MSAAIGRRTRSGAELGPGERLDPATALGLYLGPADHPGGPARRVEAGAAADLCLLRAPLREALAAPDAALVALTMIGGRVIHAAS
jgi:predicted amidohydrolase YtcJ